MPERITSSDVAYVARLACLSLTDDEIERFTEQLGSVLDYAAEVSAIDTTGVEPTAHPVALTNVLREDVPRPGLDRDEVLAMAPETEQGRFRVPPILGEAP
ncbi:MAG: Asp-tRNA(Asn)/Glu-tRNA(Gln) amidotransferase subunit GatC [Actinomycetota bacterium]|nr:Asp-tRNA(Asn)/Glu-tRNA(Gln) amidotransferase subunit GatC [Actinomycetota bacterium]MDQ3574836.1 Asp-tRNA(Asn)/Glu-tRNA(Gln) amidotransferase subunit GatC [Actinomycetota bacterium]